MVALPQPDISFDHLWDLFHCKPSKRILMMSTNDDTYFAKCHRFGVVDIVASMTVQTNKTSRCEDNAINGNFVCGRSICVEA